MTTQQQYIERLKDMVAQEFGRSIATAEDCVDLSKAIEEATDMHLDASDYATLFFPKSNIAPRPVILSALTRYVGFESWSSFCTSSDVLPVEDRDFIPTPRRWGIFILTLAAIIVVVVTAVVLLRGGSSDDAVTYNVDAVVESVEERWLARTLEECNAIRAYSEEADYTERIDLFIVEYCTTLYDEIASELISTFGEQGVTLSDADIASYAESIMAQCYTMCETLHIEKSMI